TRARGLHPLACLFSSFIAIFGGPYLAHAFAGHIAHLETMAWMPFAFHAVDQTIEKPSWKAGITGALAICMMVLAGPIQYFFFAAIGLSVYAMLSIFSAKSRSRSLMALTFMAVAGLALSAIQLLPGIATTMESSRTGGMPVDFLAQNSFPPEKILTLAFPGF